MKAVVMAGGEGTRLRPLTCNLPKPMVPVMDKPVMEYTLRLLAGMGITEIAVTLQYLPEHIKRYFGEGKEWGVNLHYYEEETPLGTAGSVKNAQNFLDETFIVVSGDALTDFALQNAVEFHRQKEALATLVLTRVESPLEYGLVLLERSGAVVRFLEKPSWGEVFSDTVNTGIYILEPEILDLIPENEVFDFSRDLFPKLLEGKGRVFGCVLDGYWCDIGSCEMYYQVHLDILDGKVKMDIDGRREGDLWVGRGAFVSPEAVIQGPAYIGPGSEIRPGAFLGPYAVLGEGCLVDKGASVKRAVIGKACYLEPRTEVRGAVLGRGVTVQTKAQIFEGAVIGDHSRIGAQATVKPGVKVWPYKRIEEGRSVLESVVWGERLSRNLFGIGGIKGQINHELTPENTARIGRALGTYFTAGARVVVGSDSFPASRILKDAVTSGLLATGIEVMDCGTCVVPAFRYAVRSSQAAGGVFCRGFISDGKRANLLVVNGDGADLPKREERKVENIWNREEFRQVLPDKIKEKTILPSVPSDYVRALAARIDASRIGKRRFFITLAAEDAFLSDTMAGLLDRAGCYVERIDGRSGKMNRAAGGLEMTAALDELSRRLRERGFGIGLYLYDGGQKLAIVDSRGRVVKDEEYVAFLASVFNSRFQIIYIPLHLPRTVEISLTALGRKVIRTKSSPGSLMEAMVTGGEVEQFFLYSDGLYAALKILEYLAEQDRELEEAIEELPPANYHKRETKVAWEHKGRVIRKLAEEHGLGSSLDNLEGVRFENPEGWILVLPDEERPVCRIYSEAFSYEMAQALTDFCEQRIREICSEDVAKDARRQS